MRRKVFSILMSVMMLFSGIPFEYVTAAEAAASAADTEASPQVPEEADTAEADNGAETVETEGTVLKDVTSKAVFMAETVSETEENGFTYSILNGTFCSITGYTGDKTELEIPQEVGGYIVQSIGQKAFQGNTVLTKVVIPDTVEVLSGYAFSGCTALTEVEIPEGVLQIYAYAFQNCSSLEKIELPDSVATLSADAFYGCGKLAEVNIPQGWTTVLSTSNSTSSYHSFYSPFRGCGSLTEVVFPEGMSSIPAYALKDCTALKKVKFAESIRQIGYGAFSGCSSINVLSLPESVTNISSYAFQNCIGLRLIELNQGLQSIGSYAFSGCHGLVSLILNHELQTIADYAFYNCGNLTAVTVPKSVTSMSQSSFSQCSRLTVYCYSGSVAHMTSESAGYPLYLLDEHEHTYKTTVETSPSCTRGGAQLKTCTICGYNYMEVLEALGHGNEVWKTVKEATCTKQGSRELQCSVCQEVLKTEYLSPLGHSYGEWIIDQEATLYTEGAKHRSCTVCGYEEHVVIEKLGESDVDISVGTVHFSIVDATTEKPIANAHVYVYASEDEAYTLTTDKNGKMTQLLPVGSNKISVYKEGYQLRNMTIHVIEGEQKLEPIGISTQPLVEG